MGMAGKHVRDIPAHALILEEGRGQRGGVAASLWRRGGEGSQVVTLPTLSLC